MKASFYALLFVLLWLHRMQAATANLEWDPNTESDLAGYRIYYGNTSGVYGTTLDVGNITRATVENLVAGQTYYFVATAYNTAGLESTPSNEVSFIASGSPNQIPVVALTAPTGGSQFIAPATIALSANATDADGSIARVEFFSGASKLGEDAAAPFEFTWSNVPAGTFQLTAVAWDNLGSSQTSAPVSISVGNPNQAPAVTLTSPLANSAYIAPASIVFSANASDSDGSIQRVEFFSDGAKLGEKTAAPFEMTSSGFAAGTYTITAVAWDDRGTSAISQSVSILVNAPPTVSLATNNTTFVAPATITLDATASDADGTIARVEFYNGTTKLGEKPAAPFSWTMTSVPAGNYLLRALAVDNRGATSSSNEIQVTVAASNQLPTVALSSPKTGALFTAPANMSIIATASDPDGSIARVEFFAGSTLLGTITTSPFSFEWANVAYGTYRLTAVAYDNLGASVTSAAVKVTVNAPPSVTVSANTSITSGSTSLVIDATASDPDGSIRRVEFYSGSVLLGKDTNSPYQFVWKNAPAGARDISAVAYDNSGASTRSSLMTVNVNGPAPSAIVSSALPKVQPLGRSYDGAFELSIAGQAGAIYDVWYSEDLRNWKLLLSVLNSEGTVIVSDYSANLNGSRFYRVSRQ